MIEAVSSTPPRGRLAEVAGAVLWLCDDDASFITGEALGVDSATSRNSHRIPSVS
ncbi:SDR family oxidoreductase [Halarchaeum rubridurum]|uniref:SDR family oxidoreductase n=1 Tax=Halarchaeum rubridurum TaxID=489911 RepID=UPI002DDC0929|nr:SDR family oxidoreductase [Halarchaeum rubridurum]